ncbi:MAG TPA: hypothetical protein VK472_02585 [Allosphingosinicella sp.]|nr:hypothetical protein [Allosphingosinicella sp.]
MGESVELNVGESATAAFREGRAGRPRNHLAVVPLDMQTNVQENKMRLVILAALAKLLRIQIHYEGIPYGGRARALSSVDVS